MTNELNIIDKGIRELNNTINSTQKEINELNSKIKGIKYAKNMLEDLRDELLNKKTNESNTVKESIEYSMIDTSKTNVETSTSRNIIDK